MHAGTKQTETIMDLETINIVITVARLKSFSATALSIPCSQSSVSRRVESAENELGVRIFERPSFGGNKTLTLTEAGEDIVKSMVKVVDSYTELFRVANAALGEISEVINLGIVSNMMPPQGFTRMKSDFYDRCPDITLHVKMDRFSDLISQFRIRNIDAVLFTSITPIDDFSWMESGEYLSCLGLTEMSVGVSVNSSFAKNDFISLPELKDATFLLCIDDGKDRPVGRSLKHSNLRNNCVKAGFEPNIKAISNDMLEIRYEKAKSGKGIFPSHTPVAWRHIEGIKYLPVIDYKSPSYFYLLRAEGRKEAPIDSFESFFMEHTVQMP